MQQKEFITGYNSWEKKKDLENTKELVVKFERRMNAEVRRQEKLDIAEEKDFKRGELPEKYMARMLYEQDDGNFENEYLKKLERNQNKQKEKDRTRQEDEARSSSGSKTLEEGE